MHTFIESMSIFLFCELATYYLFFFSFFSPQHKVHSGPGIVLSNVSLVLFNLENLLNLSLPMTTLKTRVTPPHIVLFIYLFVYLFSF